jgi:hypothetical protein
MKLGLLKKLNQNGTFEIDIPTLVGVIHGKPKNLELDLPVKDSSVNLKLTRREIFTENFKVTDDSGKTLKVDPGVHYDGIVEGKQNSNVSISFTRKGISGLINDEGRSIDINNISGDTHHLQEVLELPEFDCSTLVPEELTQDDFVIENTTTSDITPMVPEDLNLSNLNTYVTTTSTKTIKCFWECDYDMFQYYNSDTQVLTTWVTALFNSVSAIYAAEGISVTLNEIKIWTSGPSPYRTCCGCTADTYNTGCFVKNYRDYHNLNNISINGDCALLLTTSWPNPQTGGRTSNAYVSALCTTSKYAAHQIYPTLTTPGTPPPQGVVISWGSNTYYSYSNAWNVSAAAHEIGHNFGCHHTFSAAWNCNYTVGSTGTTGSCCIDCCAGSAGCACSGTTCPPSGATIMSYGSLNQFVFGPQPQQRMVNFINSRTCLASLIPPTPTPTSITPTPSPTYLPPTPTPTQNWECSKKYDVYLPFTSSTIINGVSFSRISTGSFYTNSFTIASSTCIKDTDLFNGPTILSSQTATSGSYTLGVSTPLSSIALQFGSLQETDVLTFNVNNGTTSVELCYGCCGTVLSQNQISGTLKCTQIISDIIDGGAINVLVTSTLPFDQITLSISTPNNNTYGKLFKIINFRTSGTVIPLTPSTTSITKTPTPSQTSTPSNTPSNTQTSTSTSTPTGSIGFTPMVTNSPTVTKTPAVTRTPTRTPKKKGRG